MMRSDIQDVHASAQAYQTTAEAYENGRAEYPVEAVRALTFDLDLTAESQVVELGAGTGKFTRVLSQFCPNILALEPVPAMREKLSLALPSIRVQAGTAESIPLVDQSADAVFVATAFHWFNADLALKEIQRILKPQGVLGLIWIRDGVFTSEWGEAINTLVSPFGAHTPQYGQGNWKQAFAETSSFTPLQERTMATRRQVTPLQVVDRIASISYISALPDKEHKDLLQKVASVLETHPSSRGQDSLVVESYADIYWCRKI